MMTTEQWALSVSIVALIASIGIPIYQWQKTSSQEAASKRTLLLQSILSTKSLTYVSMHELIWLLNRHGSKMDAQQRSKLKAMVPRMREHHDDLERLHQEWSNYEDGNSLAEIERMLASVDVMSSEASDTAKLIENGQRSYADT